MRRSPPPHGSAFTLIDLLVVIAIIAILAALSLPALSNAKLRAHDRRWLDAPPGRHGNAAGFTFVDGHSAAFVNSI